MSQSRDDGLPEIALLTQQLATTESVLAEPPIGSLHLPPRMLDLQTWRRQVDRQRQHASQRFTVMLLGEYSSGKSTLLNALLALPPDRRLSVRDDPTGP